MWILSSMWHSTGKKNLLYVQWKSIHDEQFEGSGYLWLIYHWPYSWKDCWSHMSLLNFLTEKNCNWCYIDEEKWCSKEMFWFSVYRRKVRTAFLVSSNFLQMKIERNFWNTNGFFSSLYFDSYFRLVLEGEAEWSLTIVALVTVSCIILTVRNMGYYASILLLCFLYDLSMIKMCFLVLDLK